MFLTTYTNFGNMSSDTDTFVRLTSSMSIGSRSAVTSTNIAISRHCHSSLCINVLTTKRETFVQTINRDDGYVYSEYKVRQIEVES